MMYASGILITNAVIGTYFNLEQCNLDVSIQNQVAITTTKARFHNQTGSPSPTVFAFPLSPDASATRLKWQINGVWHEAEIVPGSQGTIVPPGTTMNPFIESYLGKTPVVFAISEPLLAGAELIFELQYVQLLKYANGAVSYTFPADYRYLSNPALDSLNVNVSINGGRTITDLTVENYPNADIQINGNSATAQLNVQGFIPDHNIELTYTLAMDNLGASTFSTVIDSQYVPDELGDGFFMSIVEPEPSGAVIQKYFTFVMDRSTTMFGASMEQAKNAATYMITNLNAGDYFNIVDFSTVASTFAVNHVPFNEVNRNLAIAYINNLNPQGSCNISGAFDTAIPQFTAAPADAASIVVFLSKGIPGVGIVNTTALVDHVNTLVQGTGRLINIFCFGAGTNVNFQLLSLISAANSGMATYVGLNDLEDTLIDFYVKIKNPILLSPILSIDQSTGTISEVYPFPLPNLYLGTQVLLCGRYAQNTTTLSYDINGNALGTPVNYHYNSDLSAEAVPQNVFLMKLWAKLKIEHLLNLYYQLPPNSSAAIALHDQIVSISVDYGVLCTFTSFSGGEVDTPEEEHDTDDVTPPVTAGFRLLGNYPNPFNPSTVIRFEVYDTQDRDFVLNIYDLKGRLVRSISVRVAAKGINQIFWDGLNEDDRPAGSGVYLYQLSNRFFKQTGKMLMMK
jgi:Ca-activated chloride channel family protein